MNQDPWAPVNNNETAQVSLEEKKIPQSRRFSWLEKVFSTTNLFRSRVTIQIAFQDWFMAREYFHARWHDE